MPRINKRKVIKVKAWAVIDNDEFGCIQICLTRSGPLPYAIYRHRYEGGNKTSTRKTVPVEITYTLPSPAGLPAKNNTVQ
jgi:hypothetical protein